MNNFNRRSFLKSSSILAGATLVTPSLISCQNTNSKLNIAAIGIGGRGRANWNPALETENLVAMCDVCLLYTSPSPRDRQKSRMPSSA